MAFSSGNDSGGPMAEINVTPLVDVMLVLLIIFMITTPLMNHKVKVQLPEATLDQKPDKDKVPPVTISVTEAGRALAAQRSRESRYAGPMPVPLELYQRVVRAQRPALCGRSCTNERSILSRSSGKSFKWPSEL